MYRRTEGEKIQMKQYGMRKEGERETEKARDREEEKNGSG